MIDDEVSPVIRLTNFLLLDAIKRSASHLRVRSGENGGVDERHDREWRDLGLTTHELWPHVIARLALMADIDSRTVTLCGSRVRLVLGSSKRCELDVTFARTPVGAVIVLGLVPPSPDRATTENADLERTRSAAEAHVATASAAMARGDHDVVRRELRESIALATSLGESLDAAALLRRAAAFALWAGLEDIAIELLERVIRIRDAAGSAHPSEVVDVELALGDAYDALDQVTRAQPHYERAVEAAEMLGPESGLVVIALSSAGSGCARCGDVARAMRLLERADAVATVLVGRDSSLLVPRLELARVVRSRDANAAVVATERVLALAESYGDDEMTYRALGELAETELARGSIDAASEYAKRALTFVGAHPASLPLYGVRARALLVQDRKSEALTVLRAAADIARRFRPSTHPDRIAIENELAQAQQSTPYR